MAEAEPLVPEREPTWDQKVVKLNKVLAERPSALFTTSLTTSVSAAI